MKPNNHNKFILTSITKILEDAISASKGIGEGIENYALYDYIMQSVFLKMTGAQEQKFKCIIWELATNDYTYRYKRFTKTPLGECSRFDEKLQVYKDLVEQIPNFTLEYLDNYIDDNQKNIIIDSTLKKIKEIFDNSCLKIWNNQQYLFFESNYDDIFKSQGKVRILEKLKEKGTPQKIKSINLFDNQLKSKYELLYNHRNRCAHNTLSYQQNLPTFDTLRKEEYVYENYFVYFSILILIDEIMMTLYEKYLEEVE